MSSGHISSVSGHRRRLVAAAVCAVACAAALSACGASGGSSSSGGTSTSRGDVALGFASPVSAQPGQQDIIAGVKAAAKSLGWTVSVLDANLSPDRQVANVQTFITQGVDAIASWTIDPGAIGGAYQQAEAKGIPVVGMNSEGVGIASNIAWEVFSCTPGDIHDRIAEYIAERSPHAKVLVIGPPPVPSLLAHTECFKKAANAAGLEIVGEQANVHDNSATAAPIVANLLTKHPDATAIWAYNDASALGASAAVIAAKKPIYSRDRKGIMIIGNQADPEAVAAIAEGRMTATIDDQTAATGWAIVKALTVHFDDGEPISAMPKEIELRAELVDGSNVDRYVPQRERHYDLDDLPTVRGS